MAVIISSLDRKATPAASPSPGLDRCDLCGDDGRNECRAVVIRFHLPRRLSSSA
jgi:hypothetical protein